jgi:PAS domain S-box-containing protein
MSVTNRRTGRGRWARRRAATLVHRSKVDLANAARRRAERALGESERRYRDLVDQSLGLICAHDLDGRLLLVNPAAARSLGYSPEEGTGRDLREFLAADTRHLFDDYLARIVERGEDAGLMRVISRDGSERIWMYRNVLRRYPGRPALVLGHALDLTDRIQTERDLRESRHALEAAYHDLDGRVRERTAALEDTNERLRQEMTERRRAEETRERMLVDQRNTLSFLAEVSEQLAATTTFDGAWRIAGRLPVPFLADWSIVHVLNGDGTVRGIGGTHADQDRQAALATLAKTTSGRLDPACTIARMLATEWLEPLPPPVLESCNAFLGPGTRALVNDMGCRRVAVVPLVANHKAIGTLSLVGTTKERFAISDVAIMEDFARRVCMTLERIRLYEEAQEANRLKEDFLTTLSHELRTPLNAILGWARILQLRGVDASTSKAVNVIARNAEAQTRLIEEILDVSRIVTGKMRLDLGWLDLSATVRAALDVVRPAAEAKGVRLDEHLGPPLAPLVGDSHRLQQVVWNLLSNAVKFTDEGGLVTVRVSSGAENIEIVVEDSGIGIRPEVLPFVFDRFRQADSSTTRAHGGLGLGLAIARHLVHLHGGTIAARSAGEGRGSTFTVHLPIATRAQLTELQPVR